MTWQGLIVAAVVTACAVYLARRWYGMLVGKSTGCGCGSAGCTTDAPAQLSFNPKSKIQNPK